MLILPIVNRNRILKVEIKLKDMKKIEDSTKVSATNENDIIVGDTFYNTSSYGKKIVTPDLVTEFIRNNNMMRKKKFLVTTKEYSSRQGYDIYELPNVAKKTTKFMDNLYGCLILDLKNQIPDRKKAKYIDLEKIGASETITDDKLSTLKFIASNLDDDYRKRLKDNNLLELIEMLNSLETVECNVIPNSAIKIEDFEKMYNSLNSVNTPEVKALKNYYEIALSNQAAYSKISRLYNIVYNRPLNWIKKNSSTNQKEEYVYYKELQRRGEN